MMQEDRRQFLKRAAVCAAGLSVVGGPLGPFARQALVAASRRMKIVDVEVHQVLPPYQDFNAKALYRYHGVDIQTLGLYIVRTDNGLEGYGESWNFPPTKERFSYLIGTDPFDWIADTRHLVVDMAVYDLMGKYLGLPVWKLLGQRVRTWVPVAAWTVSQEPAAMANEVRNAARSGYRWLKYHVDSLQNVIDQTAAMQKVAPAGFRVHYDFNGDSDAEAVYPVLRELEKFRVAGRVEDPIKVIDRGGYRMLRGKCRIPILVHQGPVEPFVLENLCDGFIAGHAPVGTAIRLNGLAETTNTPFMLQQVGATINRAFLAHQASVFKMATLDHVDGCNLWKDGVNKETMPVIDGRVAVPDKPGLGITIDRRKLEEYTRAAPPKYERFLVRIRYASGLTVYVRQDWDAPDAESRFLALRHGRFELFLPPDAAAVPGPYPGYANPVVTDMWSQPGSQEFEDVWQRTAGGVYWTSGKGDR